MAESNAASCDIVLKNAFETVAACSSDYLGFGESSFTEKTQEPHFMREDESLEQSRITASLQFGELPDDIIYSIAKYLSPLEIASGWALTNRRFCDLFSDVDYWKRRIRELSSNKYPVISDVEEPPAAIWRSRCFQRETQWRNFANAETEMFRFKMGPENGGVHFADINAMTFTEHGKLLFTGGRDRQVVMWDIGSLKKDSKRTKDLTPKIGMFTHHDGWVSSLHVCEGQLSSGGWDNTLAIHDIQRCSERLMTMKCNHPVISHMWEPGRLVAGLMFGTIVVFDPRTGKDPVLSDSMPDAEALLSVQVVGDQAIFVGSNRKLVVFDFRANQAILKQNIFTDDFGCKIHAANNHLWIGSKHGKVLLYDMNFELVEDFTDIFGHTKMGHITGLHSDAGHVLTCALDNKAVMIEPARIGRVIFSAKGAKPGFTSLAYSDPCTLALASGLSVSLWWPKL